MHTPRLLAGVVFATILSLVSNASAQTTPPVIQPPVTPPIPIVSTGWSVSPVTIDTAQKRSLAHSARLANISVRSVAGSGPDALVAGAVVQGTGSLPLLVRAIGPGLRSFGVANALRDPALELFRATASAAKTTAFASDATVASNYVGAFPLTASNGSTAGDAALLGEAAVGTLTAQCSSASNASGVALLEFYDATAQPTAASPRFVNLSSRARVETGEGLIVIGFVIEGEGELRLLLRGVGPTLSQFNVPGVLSDPNLELFAGSTRLAANDNWRSDGPTAIAAVEDAGRALGAFDLSSPNDAALLVTLKAGSYTLHVRGAAGQSGVALAEIYEVTAAAPGFDVGRSTNAVGLDLYRSLAATAAGQNLAISPYSIQSALALAYAGAAGDTRAEMARVLRFPEANAALQSGFADLRTSLDAIAAQSIPLAQARSTSSARIDPIEWGAANRIFGQQGYGFRTSFLTLMNDGFAAPLQLVDFSGATEPSRLLINDWVAQQTRQRITNLIPSGGVRDDTRMVLVNAIYLKAPWESPFAVSATAPQPFHPTPATTRSVPTMIETSTRGYAVEDGMTVVTLGYLGQGLQCVIILPDQGQTTEAAAARLTPEHFARWAKLPDTGRRSVTLYLPKFKLQGETINLTSALQQLGLSTAFDIPRLSANFDGIAPRRPDDYLSISKVFHQTFVAVDEAGTEAAAATAVVVAGTTSINIPPVPPTEVRVDRPFLFALQHRPSGACLFIGRIVDPQ